jgi:5'-deoxynucleotidase
MTTKFEHKNYIINAMIGEFSRLRNVVRYSGRATIRPETVAEHSYFVAVIAGAIAREYMWLSNKRLDLTKVYEMSLVHDIEEVTFGDIPSPAKVAHPELLEAYEGAVASSTEAKLKKSKGRAYEHFYNRSMEEGSKEFKIMKLADVLQRIQYTYDEYMLGNRRMRHVLKEGIKQVDSMLVKYEDKYLKKVLKPVMDLMKQEVK